MEASIFAINIYVCGITWFNNWESHDVSISGGQLDLFVKSLQVFPFDCQVERSKSQSISRVPYTFVTEIKAGNRFESRVEYPLDKVIPALDLPTLRSRFEPSPQIGTLGGFQTLSRLPDQSLELSAVRILILGFVEGAGRRKLRLR